MKIIPISPDNIVHHSAQIPGCYCTHAHAKAICETGIAFAAVNPEGLTVAMAGVMKLWPGVGEGWSFITDKARLPFFLHRAVFRQVELVAKNWGLHRIHSHTKQGDLRSERWMVALGFNNEGAMVQYTADKQTVTIWSKTWTRSQSQQSE